MQQIRDNFERMAKLSDEEWDAFSSKLIREEFPKKAAILKKDHLENYLSFVEKGLVRYYIAREESDLTFAFVFDGEFASGYDSFITRLPAHYTIEALADTVLWRISYNDLQDIYAETKIGNTIGRLASESLFLKKTKRELSLLNDSAEQRYRNLFTEQPQLIQKIPQKYLASYIGITPQALSRIRKRIY
ncbi:CRP-like cAMP-binding protein [Flavobacterium sp. 90]|uniref:Crp/Fnr family transcriptional regulator n=1 Tax=unclassified Flavobacterium TaxID=196869 RepID=UPI000EAFC7E8|nr:MULTISPECIES: Crp/Fnr family transcriptional regulator [unclassified Flavobacterium]RKR11338.1 CRP-like cAMP-binding protein [Flavobacterium sp. 81]TCK55119.1 CRP-like cAMP-binding protein [Flavobacterium sp. 90]